MARLLLSDPLMYCRHEILSDGKRGLSAPYGEHWRRWRKVDYHYTNMEMTDKLMTWTRIFFGVASAHGDEREGCAVLP
jgi:hypothetical protein